jgi:hypothetical protein
MLDDVPMKCTFRHLSHMTPIWIGMRGDYGTIWALPFGGFSSYRSLPWGKQKRSRAAGAA